MSQRDCQKDYDDFWKELVENPNGTLNKDQVVKELSDYSMLMEHMASLYTFATGNKVSYITTLPGVVYGLFEEELQETYERGYKDGAEDAQQKEDRSDTPEKI
jgi:hypothetical protein